MHQHVYICDGCGGKIAPHALDINVYYGADNVAGALHCCSDKCVTAIVKKIGDALRQKFRA